jgi:hypothetical protein
MPAAPDDTLLHIVKLLFMVIATMGGAVSLVLVYRVAEPAAAGAAPAFSAPRPWTFAADGAACSLQQQ